MNKRRRQKFNVMMVGSAEQSKGGVASVIKVMKGMPFWEEYSCYWLGTQIQGSKWQKLRYALTSYIVAIVKIWRYDIIHFHTVPDLICLVIQLPVFLFAIIGRKKVIMHIHMGNQIEEHVDDKLFNWCLQKSNLIIVLARIWKEKFENEWFPDLTVPVEVVYNAYSPVEAIPYSDRDKTILMAAYLNENKGYKILFKAFLQIRDEYPDWHLVILGNGEVDVAKQYAKRLGIGDKVEFLGYLVGKEKEQVFQKASIYCMCSYQEGFPMVVLEAWGYGIPLITTPVGGLPDVLEEGKNASVFPFGDAGKLAKELKCLIMDSAKRAEMSEYSKMFVDRMFSMDQINCQVERFYNQLMS